MDLEWCKSSDVGLPAPDCVLYMDLPIEKAEKRGAFGEERYEVKEMQLKVRENFKALMTPSWQVIDADNTVENLSNMIEEIALNEIECASTKPIEKLWVETIESE